MYADGQDEITNSADFIDSRDVIARIEYLEDEFADQEISVDNGADEQHEDDGSVRTVIVTCGECGRSWNDALISDRTPAPGARCPYEYLHDELAELDALLALASEASDYASDWEHGETLIRDTYFEEYAQELADDIGGAKPDVWPYTHIDWEAAARDLQQDYTTVSFDGVDYWIR